MNDCNLCMLHEMTGALHRYNVGLTYYFGNGVTDKQHVGFGAFVLLFHKRPIDVVEELHAPSEHCHTRELSLLKKEKGRGPSQRLTVGFIIFLSMLRCKCLTSLRSRSRIPL